MHDVDFTLLPFPVAEQSAARVSLAPNIEINGSISRVANAINVVFRVSGDNHHVKHASRNPSPTRKDNLWRTTCFELFLKLPAQEAYWEYNLSPSHDWNVYHFSSYRSELTLESQIEAIEMTTTLDNANFVQLQAALPIPISLRGQPLDIAISSVAAEQSGKLHYFALRHAGAKPDFHHPAGFVLHLVPVAD